MCSLTTVSVLIILFNAVTRPGPRRRPNARRSGNHANNIGHPIYHLTKAPKRGTLIRLINSNMRANGKRTSNYMPTSPNNYTNGTRRRTRPNMFWGIYKFTCRGIYRPAVTRRTNRPNRCDTTLTTKLIHYTKKRMRSCARARRTRRPGSHDMLLVVLYSLRREEPSHYLNKARHH